MADVLIIDDDTLTAQTLARLLGAHGHDARTATDATTALRSLKEREPDLIVLDLALPRLYGLELLDALRDEPRFAGVQVAVYTGHDDPEARATAQQLGVCGFIVKGQDWPATCEQIERCLPRERTNA